MTEREVKILDIDIAAVEDRLQELEFDLVFDDEIVDLIFDTPEHTMNANDDVLRLRKMGKEMFITFKRKLTKDDIAERKEIETPVSDIETMKELLLELGYIVRLEVRKHRISYKKDTIRVELDHFYEPLEKIPDLLEIEGQSREEIFSLAGKLGYDAEACLNWSLNDLLRNFVL